MKFISLLCAHSSSPYPIPGDNAVSRVTVDPPVESGDTGYSPYPFMNDLGRIAPENSA
jgi:hypothetical protein